MADSATDAIQIPLNVLIGVSVGAGVLLIVLVSLLIYCTFRRRAHNSQDLYYKFEDPSVVKESTMSASASYSGERPRTGSKRKKRPAMTSGVSFASNDDAIAAPRLSESEVKGTGVAFLDDFGRPIAASK